ncbi:MAG: biopolymer transporter ExbD [Betaproteobacteria bacterium]|nr:biopolymer transporter ExbD [Betaproteobacteria bacterium]MBI3938084.1 biopolymer transporter ExbD [Betaproteobacteria bacterium]
MKFGGSFREEPEINFIPLIDVLLVILIFLMVTTTYSRYAELQITLPTAEATRPQEPPEQVNVAVDAAGRYVVNKTPVAFNGPEAFSEELRRAAGGMKDPAIIINADANASHQSVINILEAARIAGYGRITFTTQAAKK